MASTLLLSVLLTSKQQDNDFQSSLCRTECQPSTRCAAPTKGFCPGWGEVGHWSPKNIFMLSRSAANPAQPEPPLQIDALTMLKKDIPACQKHPAGSIWVLKFFVIFLRIPKLQPFFCRVGGNSLGSRSEGGAWCPGWEEVGAVSRGFYQSIRVVKKEQINLNSRVNDMQNIDIENSSLILQGLLQTAMAIAFLFPVF